MRTRRGAVLGLLASIAVPISAFSQVAVVCTTTIVGDVVRAVAGPEPAVAVLFPVGADPHSFQASPLDAAVVEAADIIFLSGGGLEAVLVPLLEAARGRVVDLSEALPLQEAAAGPAEGRDPHVWLNPLYVAIWGEKIAESLAGADPENASAYRDRAAAYRVQMEELDRWIRDRVAAIPMEARRLVTDHKSLGVFAAAYDFVEVGTVVPGYSTLAEPSAHEIALLEDAIRAASVPCMFVETAFPSALAEQVAADTQTEIRFLYIGSLSAGNGPAPTYDALMRFDVEEIVQGLIAP